MRAVLSYREDGELLLQREGGHLVVRVQRCFPWSNPLQFLALVDREGHEVELVKEVDELDCESQRALLSGVRDSGFVFEVSNVLSIDEEFELWVWKVETHQGIRGFQTKVNHWPRALSSGGVLIQDIFGDIYFIRDPELLPDSGRNLLWAFMD